MKFSCSVSEARKCICMVSEAVSRLGRKFAIWETFKTFMQVIKKQRIARSLMPSISLKQANLRGSVSLFKILGGMLSIWLIVLTSREWVLGLGVGRDVYFSLYILLTF